MDATAVLVWLSAAIKPISSPTSSPGRRRETSSSPAATHAARPSSPRPPSTTAAVVDIDAVLGVMTGTGPASVGFEEAVALFDEEEATAEEARAAFAVFDRDGDGFIDAGELGSVLRSLGLGSGDEECRRMIDAYDEDGDGRIDFQEFVKLMEQ